MKIHGLQTSLGKSEDLAHTAWHSPKVTVRWSWDTRTQTSKCPLVHPKATLHSPRLDSITGSHIFPHDLTHVTEIWQQGFQGGLKLLTPPPPQPLPTHRNEGQGRGLQEMMSTAPQAVKVIQEIKFKVK